ncbi:ubiquinol-cytochrome c reductase cytochrome b subunit [Streptomyces sp. TRM 70351]|uniref:cytochrome bc1 complex cytochrome b subunit n=1 Tax=Streptomyces sp. TRM 70351 TaxID=3116552 RepID=UPI002E7B9E8C|nr:ubiquinol-cytochrome c reductase cytochrome b subunit [Streptomyces sp. TRM 70351]MEE1928976.1 ubiquinol-cytochrome c reductase cytochrome b subunit [Streptomyces sp. TRM 70351]
MLPSRKKARCEERTRQAALRGFDALDARLPLAEGARHTVRKAFPGHWSFLLGELALYSFAVLLLTGVFLTLFFKPSMAEVVYEGGYAPLRGVLVSEAYASTLDISFDVRGGLLIRQMHHWAALLFLASIALHLLRVFFTGAFRKPREVNWMVGVTLFLLALLEGFSGYSLPDDLLSGTGLRTAQGIVQSVPVAGTYLSFLAFGGEYPGDAIIPRLFTAHVLLVPGVLLALVTLHLLLVFRLKHTQWARPGRTNRNVVGEPMVPHFAAKSGGLFLMVSGVLALFGALVQINPVWSFGPYRPDQVSTFSQPDWYVGFLEGALRLMPPVEITAFGHTLMLNVLVPAVLLPGALFAVLYLYPFAEKWITGDGSEHHLCDRPRDRPVRTGLGAAGITFYAALFMAGGNDLIAFTFDVSLNALTWTFRTAVLLGPFAAFMITKRLCLALQERDRERLTHGEETGRVRQSLEGGFEASHTPLPREKQYPILVRDVPPPLEDGPGRGRRRDRLRRSLNRWSHRSRVEMPATSAERREIAARTAPPARPDEED